MAARVFWLTVIIWVIVGWIIERSFHIGGSPLIAFIVQIILLFFVFLFVRVGVIKVKFWWHDIKQLWARIFRSR